MNPIEFMKGIKNPQQFVINMLGQNQTLMGAQLMNLAKTGDKTQKENYQDMVKCGRDRKNKANIKARGEKNPFHKLTSEQVKEIYLSKLSYKKMSKIYNVSTTNINLIKHKKSWQWLTNTLD